MQTNKSRRKELAQQSVGEQTKRKEQGPTTINKSHHFWSAQIYLIDTMLLSLDALPIQHHQDMDDTDQIVGPDSWPTFKSCLLSHSRWH